MAVNKGIEALQHLGLTHLEAEIYTFLVRESPATGYRVAKVIGKPAANTYKAIQTLAQKGAVLVEEGASRQCWAVPPTDFLAQLEIDSRVNRVRADKALNAKQPAVLDEREFPIGGFIALVARLRKMLQDAQQIALAVFPPQLATLLEESISAALERQVDVLVRSEFLPALVEPTSADPSAFAPANDVRLVVDGTQYCIASLEQESVLTGIWSTNSRIALTVHAGLAAEFCLSTLAEKIADDAGQKRLLRTLGQLRLASATAGFAATYSRPA